MDDLIERLLNAEPGARQEAAAEIRRLTGSLAAMEREREVWKAECEAWRTVYDKARSGSGAGTTVNFREAMNARAATDALMKQSPESAPKEPPNA